MYTNWPFGAKANTRTIHMSDIFFFFSPIEKKFSAEADVKVGQCENGSRIPGSWKEGNTRSSEPQRKCFSN